jgi:NAD(P)-dependent dehydrogenase (short-subunit alcohol dehydrogenase family)
MGLRPSRSAAGRQSRGAKVSIAGRRAADLDAVVAEIEAFGGTALAVPTDVSGPAQVAALVEQTVARFGRLDAAFNNAGTEGAWARSES